MKEKYKIISAENVHELEDAINDRAACGWKLIATDIRPPFFSATMSLVEKQPKLPLGRNQTSLIAKG